MIILQGECASINGNRFNNVGTPFATTCNCIFLLNKSMTKCVLAHLDEGCDKKQLIDIFKLFTKLELQTEGVQLYIIGGYLDEKAKSVSVTNKILSLISSEKKFKNFIVNLRLLFTSHLNTNYKMVKDEEKDDNELKVSIPVHQNIGYSLESKKFYIFTIKSKYIPYYDLRGAIIFKDDKKTNIRIIYDSSNKKDILNGAKIDSFKWKCPDWVHNVLSYNLSDDKILKYFSTSPYAEHKEFAKDSKNLFKYISQNDPKEIFKNNKPIYLEKGIILKKKKKKKNKNKDQDAMNGHNDNNNNQENDNNYMDEEKSSK